MIDTGVKSAWVGIGVDVCRAHTGRCEVRDFVAREFLIVGRRCGRRGSAGTRGRWEWERDGGVKSVYHLSRALVEVMNDVRDVISNLCHRDWVARTCDPVQRTRVRAAEEEASSRQIRWAAAVLPFRQIREEAKQSCPFIHGGDVREHARSVVAHRSERRC